MSKLSLLLFAIALIACRGPKGDQGNTGATGSQGIAGIQGPQGVPGLNGTDGADGEDGEDATGVGVVKFCQETASYPSTFPEYGVCIQNQLYAVYSTNGGFLALIPPGTYHSNAVGSVCDFTVLPNCQVQ